jgi:subtilisin family serine protease
VALAVGLACLPAAAAADQRPSGPTPIAGTSAQARELLVRFGSRATPSERADARRGADARLEDRLPLPGLELVRVEPGTATGTAERRLESDPSVLYAEPNHRRSAMRLPNDPHFSPLWGLHNTGQAVNGVTGTSDADVDGPEAWDLTVGSPAVTVAIVDSGVSLSHPDLGPNAWANPGETGGGRQSNGIDDDHNGYVDDANGWDWVDSDADPADANGHGTHVAGTVAARGDNGTGVSGVAWHAGLMALRALDAAGNGSVADAIEAYTYAGSKGARVLNASFGGPVFSRAEYDAIRAVPGVLFVAAAGNEGLSNDVVPQYPCNYELPNIVCVAATGQQDALATFSNYGARTVDLAAPGSRILSTWPSGYAYSSGTSMATPHVSGAAALTFAARSGATPASVKAALLAGVDPVAALAGRTVTGGRLNAYASLTGHAPAAASPAPPPGAPPRAVPDRTPPRVVVKAPRRVRLRTLLRRGVRVTVGCSEGCSVRAKALIARTARRNARLAAALTVAGRAAAQLPSSKRRTMRIRLRPSAKRRLARARRPRLQLAVSARDAAQNTRVVTRRIAVRRSR